MKFSISIRPAFWLCFFQIIAISFTQQGIADELRCFSDRVIVSNRHRPGDQIISSSSPLQIHTEAFLNIVFTRPASNVFPEAEDASACSLQQNPCKEFRRAIFRDAQKHKTMLYKLRHHHSICERDYELTASRIPNDSYYSQLWGLGNSTNNIDIDAPSAWDIETGSSNPSVVGIIDTGVDFNHPDLIENIWSNPNEIPNNGIDDDRNGYIDDLHGVDAITGTKLNGDDGNHGTHCAGTIASHGNNSSGVVGVSWSAKIIGCKFLSSTGTGSSSAAIRCIDYFTDLKLNRGINVVVTNNSWGGAGYLAALEAAIERAANAGITFVAAAGNASQNIDQFPSYPAAHTNRNIISVASIESTGIRSSFSNYGVNSVDIAAPGGAILSTYPNNQYAINSGTSMAAPHITGAIALLKSYCLNLNVTEIRAALLSNAKPLASLNGVVATGGMLSLRRMLDGAGCSGIPATPTATPSSTSTVPAGITRSATPTSTFTATSTSTPTAQPSATSVPTNTNTPTNTTVPSNTPTAQPTATSVPTNTNTSVPTFTITATPSNTPTAQATATSVPAKTSTPLPSATNTPNTGREGLQLSISKESSTLLRPGPRTFV